MVLFAGINLGNAFGPIETNLTRLNDLQKAAADNIANVSTPGYRPKRYNFSAYMTGGHGDEAGLMNTPLSTKMGGNMMNDLLYTHGEEGKVNLQQEFMDMQTNFLYFTMASRLMNTAVTNMKTASQVGR